ncbi:Putative transferase caf-17,mitochondrial [Taphrina deformans PYCC 5710]|uniref:Transferase caf-17,mitochondrial n=1 Tax=Taphrina deformans (strain PYCC 5710 / ATCC 11124 / CBS 356.35 / IMI 108563 / JCM 9778 / NBRC 8474) TaxID=1097556 RepID=R4X761_TAPDE|nr:Putative transferase caf-17,mitochondrial [Taphrina deformans PYCC 5710]|eukprot:CCG81106.1 Putative transferase caf-17,mitochondrial [Taphrina deformans PYCC 5710]
MPNLVHLPHRSLISIKGRDTFKYLQALTTNNLSRPQSQYTSFLNAQGRVLYDAFIYRTAESECLVEVDASLADGVVGHLGRYKLRSKFEMRRLDPSELGIYSLFDQSAAAASVPAAGSAESVLQDTRAPNFGTRIVSSSCPSAALDLEPSSVLEYVRHRYRHGVPEGPDELVPGRALPMESNIDYMNGLDFHKGCYLGQELTVRTYHTGVIRKRIVPVTVPPSAENRDAGPWSLETEGSQVTFPTESGVKARPAGRVLGGVGTLGLALLRLDKVGQRGQVTINGSQVDVVASRPGHWPSDPGSM